MSGHADTIRRWLVGYPDAVPRDGDTALDALLAENQRLRDALAEIAHAVPGMEYKQIAREALAGDAE